MSGNHKDGDWSYWDSYKNHDGLIKDSSLLNMREDILNENTKRN